MELVGAAVKFAGACFRYDADDSRGRQSVLRLVVRSQNADFLDRFGGDGHVREGNHAGLVEQSLLHRDAVEGGFVSCLQTAIDTRGKRSIAGSGAHAGHKSHEPDRRPFCAGGQQRKGGNLGRSNGLLTSAFS